MPNCQQIKLVEQIRCYKYGIDIFARINIIIERKSDCKNNIEGISTTAAKNLSNNL